MTPGEKYNFSFNSKSSYVVRKNSLYFLGVFAISPFLSLLVGIKNYKASWSKNAAWLFVAFYGFTLVISNEGMDASVYRDKFLQMAHENMSFSHFTAMLYSENSQILDVLQPLLSFIVSQFSSDPRILFLSFALVFGYFYSRNIWYLVGKSNAAIKKENTLIIITFAFIIGFWQINGFRMWTAAHVFFFGAIRYIYEKDKKALFFALLSIFIHFSFVVPLLILFLFSLIKNRVQLLFWFFLSTFFIAEINLDVIGQILKDYSPELLLSRVEGYTNTEYATTNQEALQNRSWHAIFYSRALNWVLIAFFIGIYAKGLKFIKETPSLFSLYNFSLLFMGIANLVSFVPSGGRFILVGSLFSFASIFLFLQKFKKGRLVQTINYLATPALIFYCAVTLRVGFDTIGIVTILGNPLFAIFGNLDVALIEFIK